MHIANPIYDVVFKYLMDDNKIAKKLISAIIEEDIVELRMKPTEYHTDIEKKNLTVYRVDFSAKIKLKNGEHKTVLIEIQKSKLPTDIMRFRKYLGINYSDKNNVSEEKGEYKPNPIIAIYFLGHSLEHIHEPVIAVKRKYYSRITGKEIQVEKKEDFIECLSHDSYVIQIPELKKKRKNELLRILSIFDQSMTTEEDCHIIDINEDNYPKKYKEVIRRLVKAISEPDVVKTMDLEDTLLFDLENIERKVESLKTKLTLSEEENRILEEKILRAEQERQKAEQEKQRAEQEKKKAEQEKQRAEQEKQRAEQEKKKAEQEKKTTIQKAIRRLIKYGLPPAEAEKIIREQN